MSHNIHPAALQSDVSHAMYDFVLNGEIETLLVTFITSLKAAGPAAC